MCRVHRSSRQALLFRWFVASSRFQLATEFELHANHFDAEIARDAIDFYPLRTHGSGTYAGKPFVLGEFQEFVVAMQRLGSLDEVLAEFAVW